MKRSTGSSGLMRGHLPSDRQAMSKREMVELRNNDEARAGATQPLIDRVTNKWQSEKPIGTGSAYLEDDLREFGFCDLEDPRSCPNGTRDCVRSRPLRRMLVVYVLPLLALAWFVWRIWLGPKMEAEWEFKEGFLARGNGTYGIARGGDFDGVLVQDISPELLPGGAWDKEGKRRLVFVGDIHGCARELRQLLRRVDFNEATDHLIAVGDVISKGPDNVGVLEELIRLGASSVRGNHEDRLLAMMPATGNHDYDVSAPSAETSSIGFAKDSDLLQKLKKHHMRYLRSMPLMIRVPALPQATLSTTTRHDPPPLADEILVVHAGLVPAVWLEKQDPYFVMNMRSIYSRTHLPSVEAASARRKPWHEIWAWYNDRLSNRRSLKGLRIAVAEDDYQPKVTAAGKGWLAAFRDGLTGTTTTQPRIPDPQVVVYGHHSKAGLVIGRWSKGLDTGCVGGGELTAMVLDARGRTTIASVPCRG